MLTPLVLVSMWSVLGCILVCLFIAGGGIAGGGIVVL